MFVQHGSYSFSQNSWTVDLVTVPTEVKSHKRFNLQVKFVCVTVWITPIWFVSVFPVWCISVYLCISMHVIERVAPSVFFVYQCYVCGHAQGCDPPCGWHSECIITINEKVNGAFSYISIYIWTISAHKWCLGGRGQRHSALKPRVLMCFCGHQMLWIMTRPLNTNQMTLNRPWSTVPAWKLSPTDKMKERGKTDSCSQQEKDISLFYYTFEICCKAASIIVHQPYMQNILLCTKILYHKPEVVHLQYAHKHTLTLFMLETAKRNVL